MISADDVSAIFARHGIAGTWQALPAYGIANHIFATDDVVLRVATDHPQARPDAYTEVIAAPLARSHGIAVPRLLAFQEGEYSLWERVHAETLSQLPFLPRAWRELGGELARLHDRVRECHDPNGWLDTPSPYDDPTPSLQALVARGAVPAHTAATLERWLDALRSTQAPRSSRRCFLHGDAHGGNVMCTRDGALVALIDWGDAGWGHPADEFGAVPIDALSLVVAGYEMAGGTLAGSEASILWNQIGRAVDAVESGYREDAITALLEFVRDAESRWRNQ
jgi:aminoglycoside phosphotransferase (APT) family kinase protein